MGIDGPIDSFAPFHNVNCPRGFLYFNRQVRRLRLAPPVPLLRARQAVGAEGQDRGNWRGQGVQLWAYPWTTEEETVGAWRGDQ